MYCFHYEAAVLSKQPHTPPKELIKEIHKLGLRAGVAIKPDTPVDVFYELLDTGSDDEKPDVITLHPPPLSPFTFFPFPLPPSAVFFFF